MNGSTDEQKNGLTNGRKERRIRHLVRVTSYLATVVKALHGQRFPAAPLVLST